MAWTPVRAHDIPDEIVLHGFVRPQGDRLHFLVRVPLVMLGTGLPKRGPGYIDLPLPEERLQALAAAAAREMVIHEDGVALTPRRTAARISDPADKSFASYEKALAAIAGPKLPDSANVFWNQGYFDAHLEYPIRSERAGFSFDMQFAPGLRGRLKLVLTYLPPDAPARAFVLPGGAGHVMLDPRWHQAAATFVASGFRHILEGLDHLLFLLCLVLPFRRIGWPLVAVITSFTVAHSITLIAAARGMVPSGAWFGPLVEVLIAASILYMALENIVRPNLRWRWLAAGVFGLVHGFGFSFLLQEQLQLAGEPPAAFAPRVQHRHRARAAGVHRRRDPAALSAHGKAAARRPADGHRDLGLRRALGVALARRALRGARQAAVAAARLHASRAMDPACRRARGSRPSGDSATG